MQHRAGISYNSNVTQSDSEMCYLHESSSHFQFMRKLSIQSTGLASVGSWLKLFARKGTSAMPSAVSHDTTKQTECTCARLVTHSSWEITDCVMMKCSCVRHQMGGSHSSHPMRFCLISSQGSGNQTDFKQVSTLSNHNVLWGKRERFKTNTENFMQAVLGQQTGYAPTQFGLKSALKWGWSIRLQQQPNLWSAIDIPFPLSLLSCFAFRGFALSPECPACGL